MIITGKAPKWVKTAINRMAKISLSPKCYKETKIRVKWSTNKKNEGDFGSCDWDDHNAVALMRLNSDINPLSVYLTVAHELHHVQQFYDYQLISLRDDRWLWEGKMYKSVAGSRRNYSMPWEVEARAAEKLNMKKYVAKFGDEV